MNIQVISTFPNEYAFANLFLHLRSCPLSKSTENRWTKEVYFLFTFSFYTSVHIAQLPFKRCVTRALPAFKPMEATGSYMSVPISSHS